MNIIKIKLITKIALLLFVAMPLSAQQSVHTSGGEALGPGGMKGHSISNKIKSGDQNPH